MAKQYTYEILGLIKRLESKIDALSIHLGVDIKEAPARKLRGADFAEKRFKKLYPDLKEIKKKHGF